MLKEIPDVKVFKPKRHGDHRGWFVESYSARTFESQGIHIQFVQDNQSFSAQKGTLRGLHYQKPPFAQDKLVSVLKGRALDVAVDLRVGSPTFGDHMVVELTAEEGNQILVPAGFAHGIVTLEPDTQIYYKVSAFYSPENDRGIRYDDPDLAIKWPFLQAELVLSDKDLKLPTLKNADNPFVYKA